MALAQDIALLRQVPLFARLEPEALRLIAFSAEARVYRAGDVVFRKGDRSDGAYLVTGGAVALDVAERLRAAVSASPLDHSCGGIELSVSIGVTELRPWEETVVDGIARADEAMYLAKLSGRNRVVPV